jgi:hypothetical protein
MRRKSQLTPDFIIAGERNEKDEAGKASENVPFPNSDLGPAFHKVGCLPNPVTTVTVLKRLRAYKLEWTASGVSQHNRL